MGSKDSVMEKLIYILAGDSTIPMINNLIIGRSLSDIHQCNSFKHRKAIISEDDLKRLQLEKQQSYVTHIYIYI